MFVCVCIYWRSQARGRTWLIAQEKLHKFDSIPFAASRSHFLLHGRGLSQAEFVLHPGLRVVQAHNVTEWESGRGEGSPCSDSIICQSPHLFLPRGPMRTDPATFPLFPKALPSSAVQSVTCKSLHFRKRSFYLGSLIDILALASASLFDGSLLPHFACVSGQLCAVGEGLGTEVEGGREGGTLQRQTIYPFH